MSHSIKVSEETYLALRDLQRTRETFSQVIERLIQVYGLLLKLEPFIQAETERLQRQAGSLTWQRSGPDSAKHQREEVKP